MDRHAMESVKWSEKNQGVKVIALSGAEKAEWDKLLEPITEKWIAGAKAKGLPGEAIVADIKAFGAMYAAQ
mgnify:CR=1 FL=1